MDRLEFNGATFLVSCVATGVAIGFITFIAVLLTGSTFGQRCAKAFPEDGLRQQICIQKLSKGESLEEMLPTPASVEDETR